LNSLLDSLLAAAVDETGMFALPFEPGFIGFPVFVGTGENFVLFMSLL